MEKTIDTKYCEHLSCEGRTRMAAILAEGICVMLGKRELAAEGRDTRPHGEIGRDGGEIGPLCASEALDSIPNESGNGHKPHI